MHILLKLYLSRVFQPRHQKAWNPVPYMAILGYCTYSSAKGCFSSWNTQSFILVFTVIKGSHVLPENDFDVICVLGRCIHEPSTTLRFNRRLMYVVVPAFSLWMKNKSMQPTFQLIYLAHSYLSICHIFHKFVTIPTLRLESYCESGHCKSKLLLFIYGCWCI